MDAWVGRRIVIQNDPDVEFGGRRCGGVRVDTVATREANQSAAAPAPAPAMPAGVQHQTNEQRL